MSNVIEVRELTKLYPNSPRPALDQVSFGVSEGNFTAILGRSGSGKTTLFRCLNMLLTPTSGNLVIHNTNWLSLDHHALCQARRQMATIFQHYNLITRLSVMENVLAGQLSNVPFWRVVVRRFPTIYHEWALHCLERVGLQDYADRPARQLSGGQQQRVAIARALCQRPSIILADEPVASLDPTTSIEILDELRLIATQDKITILCSLHQENFALEYADQIIGLRDGRKVVDVTRQDFSPEYRTLIY